MRRTSRHIGKGFARLHRLAKQLEERVTLFMEIIMADIQALQAKIDELRDAVEADEAADAELVTRLNATIADLQAQVAANQPVDTQPLIDELESIKASLQPAE
jgi:signal transduction histidine kinase